MVLDAVVAVVDVVLGTGASGVAEGDADDRALAAGRCRR